MKPLADTGAVGDTTPTKFVYGRERAAAAGYPAFAAAAGLTTPPAVDSVAKGVWSYIEWDMGKVYKAPAAAAARLAAGQTAPNAPAAAAAAPAADSYL